MKYPIYIRGTGWNFSPFPGEEILSTDDARDDSISGLVLGAVRSCLQDAVMEMAEIDAVITSSVDLWDGKTASNIAVTEVVGAVMKPETRIAGDGLLALFHAVMTILAGQYRKVLVVTHGKASEGDQEALSSWTFDPVWLQPLGMTELQSLGLQAQAFLRRSPAYVRGGEFRAGLVSALSGGTCTEEDLLSSPVDFYPLHRQEIPTYGDGACAVLLEAGDSQAEVGFEDDVRLEGFGYDLEPHYLGDRDLGQSAGLKRAVDRACAMIDVADNAKEISCCHWSLRSSIQLPLWAESAGLWDFEKGMDALLENLNPFQSEKDTPAIKTNSPGTNELTRRMWDGVPPFVGGLLRLICAVDELRNSARHNLHLVHGMHGPAGQLQAVCLLAGKGS